MSKSMHQHFGDWICSWLHIWERMGWLLYYQLIYCCKFWYLDLTSKSCFCGWYPRLGYESWRETKALSSLKHPILGHENRVKPLAPGANKWILSSCNNSLTLGQREIQQFQGKYGENHIMYLFPSFWGIYRIKMNKNLCEHTYFNNGPQLKQIPVYGWEMVDENFGTQSSYVGWMDKKRGVFLVIPAGFPKKYRVFFRYKV